jgi:hypothetical protein
MVKRRVHYKPAAVTKVSLPSTAFHSRVPDSNPEKSMSDMLWKKWNQVTSFLSDADFLIPTNDQDKTIQFVEKGMLWIAKIP